MANKNYAKFNSLRSGIFMVIKSNNYLFATNALIFSNVATFPTRFAPT